MAEDQVEQHIEKARLELQRLTNEIGELRQDKQQLIAAIKTAARNHIEKLKRQAHLPPENHVSEGKKV